MNGTGVMQGIKVGLLQCDNVMCTKEECRASVQCTVYCVCTRDVRDLVYHEILFSKFQDR